MSREKAQRAKFMDMLISFIRSGGKGAFFHLFDHITLNPNGQLCRRRVGGKVKELNMQGPGKVERLVGVSTTFTYVD